MKLLTDVRGNVVTEDDLAPEDMACPCCGNRVMEDLLWDDNGEWLTCDNCGLRYRPEVGE